MSVMSLLDDYKKFCDIRERSCSGQIINLGNESFLCPSSLLPLINYLKITNSKNICSSSERLNSYVCTIMSKAHTNLENKSFIPFTELPKNELDANKTMSMLFGKLKDGKDVGGQNAFKYMVSEMIDNIYQHSNFNNAYFMAQKYPKLGFMDVCFYDDGIGIPGSFRNAEVNFSSDKDAIYKAITGVSTKGKERGYGLSKNIEIIEKDFKGEMLIISNEGAVHLFKEKLFKYDLSKKYILMGTLVSYRYNFPVADVDIYERIE